MKKLLILLLMLLPFGAICQMLNPTKWEISLSKTSVKVGENVDVILTVTIEDHWHFYGLGEDPPQASITFSGSGFQEVGKVKEVQKPQEKFDENLEMKVRYFDGKAQFKHTIKITEKNPQITAEVEGQACPSGPGQCVRVNKTLEVKNLKVTAAAITPKEAPLEPKAKTTQPDSPQVSEEKSANSKPQNIETLEKEKQGLITKDSKGNDETIVYLRNFANKYGSKK